MENIVLGFTNVLDPLCLLVLVFGVILGMVVGALPGLNDTITMAVLIPITFGMEPQVAMSLLIGVYTSSCYGGSIPAILLNIPGTAASMVTTLDGYPMAQQGKARKALQMSLVASTAGDTISDVVLFFFMAPLAMVAGAVVGVAGAWGRPAGGPTLPAPRPAGPGPRPCTWPDGGRRGG